MRAFLAVLMLIAICTGIFFVVRARIRLAPHLRSRMMTGSIVTIAAGAVIGGFLPTRIPETSGSPASLVLIVLLWLIGGGLVVIGVPALVASLWKVRHEPNAGEAAAGK